MLLLFFYNLLMIVGAIVFAPLIFVKVILTPKYRSRFARRMGIGIACPSVENRGAPRIWLHALSVGEAASARNLVRELRKEFPLCTIIFSASTSSGERFARELLRDHVDWFISFPFDLLWSVHRVVSLVQPDIFVLVETDFWPNFMEVLKKKKIPAVLVNGRMSEASLQRYRKFRWFFQRLFGSFAHLAMQTAQDAENLQMLGVAKERFSVLGNLKYDAALPGVDQENVVDRAALHIPSDAVVLVAGSTHPGEEEILFRVFARLRSDFPDLFLVLAPRNIARGKELEDLAARHGMRAFCRSGAAEGGESVLVLDTLGELAAVYSLCDAAFVGGSLVPERGHNPLEAAVFAKPVLFGPSMEDFSEIARDLRAAGGAIQVSDADELLNSFMLILGDVDFRQRTGVKAGEAVAGQRGAALKHIALLRKLLQEKGKS